MGKLVHGNENFGYAPITTTGQTTSFGTPVMMEGMRAFEMEVEQDTKTIYADNRDYAKIRGAKVRTATGTFLYIPSEYASFLGYHVNANGGVDDGGTHQPHCIFFESVIVDGDTNEETRTLHYLYNVTGGEPSLSTETDEDEITEQEIEIEYEAQTSSFVKNSENKAVQYFYIERTAENASKYDTFKTTVLLPTTTI